MKFRNACLFALSLASSCILLAQESDGFEINLKDPVYKEGVVKTEHGGVICAPCLRIQAQKITYTNTVIDGEKIQQIIAEGDLMMNYQGRTFVGRRLEFDLLTKTGFLLDGRTGVDVWYLGGDRFELCSDGSFRVYGGYITTCEGRPNIWEIHAKTAMVTDGTILSAKDVRFQVLKIPFFWLPTYKSNLRRFKDPPIRYRFRWDEDIGPRLSMRYRFYSNETFNAYARLDYRIKVVKKDKDSKRCWFGPGGALEATYNSEDGCTLFQTRNYGAYDKVFPDENGNKRFRFQGLFKTKSEDERSKLQIQWDRLSDDRMVSDFRSSDFEINTKKATFLEGSHYATNAFGSITVRPQINPFQSLNQELPYGAFSIRPFEIPGTGIISENYASGSYLDYTFANQIDEFLKDRKAGRLETMNTLYRPISFGPLTVTPKVSAIGIYYSDSPDQNAVGQLVFQYGGEANMRISRRFSCLKHTVIPYANHLGYSRPQAAVDDHFIFDIHDGYDRLDQLRFGLRQLFFSKENSILLPAISLDLYGYAFWGARSFTQRIPKVFADLDLNNQTWAFHGGLAWNIQENVLDYGDARFLFTVNDAFAWGVEFRHRSRFWWRKADYGNYVVDIARPLEELLDSPLSDGRNTLLTKAYFRLSPRWQLHLQTHHGWGRKNEPRYNGVKIDLFTILTGSWQMKLTYEYAPNISKRFSCKFNLIK